MTETCSTITPLGHSKYPSLCIGWERIGFQWNGEVTIWNSSSEKAPDEHNVTVSQGSPLGTISIIVDAFSYGCWAMGSFPGVHVEPRDLQWATLFVAQAIKNHPERIAVVERELKEIKESL